MEFLQIKGNLAGLTDDQVQHSRSVYGENKIIKTKINYLWYTVKNILKEPMLVLLATASVLYFTHGNLAEGIFLLAAIVLVFSISQYQEARSKNALDALRKLTQPKCKVVRNAKISEIQTEELVIGDLIVVEEGSLIPADATIIQSNDFTVDESILTGESASVEKDEDSEKNIVYRGTLVVSGLAICKVTAIGIKTKAGLIEKSLDELKKGKSPLQIKIDSFVKRMAGAGLAIFCIIWTINIFQTRSVVDSLLNALTLAMSILPEEIPVAFTTFMALGAWRLMKLGIIVKETKTVETLGSATTICIDKTGTITKNEMSLAKVYASEQDKIFETNATEITDVVTAGMWASEPIPFDAMEKALHNSYEKICKNDERQNYTLVKEYPLGGKPPIMTHIFQSKNGNKIIAAKGAPEAILRQSKLPDSERQRLKPILDDLMSEGYRVLGVGVVSDLKNYPEKQGEFEFQFKGFLAFYDPAKENIKHVLQQFYNAGIKVKIITGDNEKTTSTIAREIRLQGGDKTITGDLLMLQDENELSETVKNTNIFARMFPEAKLRVIQALKKQGEIVAMTGDGVNDGPALKAANIGIAMGQKGSEIAKQASALVLADDDLARMVDAIAAGRKIYTNLKKAIQYIVSIHIPIILIVLVPLLLGWIYPVIFSPVHVIFLELIMGPTCSIIYENEPMENDAMQKKPRIFAKTFFNFKELSISILQGLMITAGLFVIYWVAVTQNKNLPVTTSMVFITLITANITLTLVNRSFLYSLATTIRYRNNLIPLIILITILLVTTIFAVPMLRDFFRFGTPTAVEILVSVLAGFCSVIWFEAFKFSRRIRQALA